MSSHAKPFPRWLDTLASLLSWRVSTGRHTLRPLPDSAGATPAYAKQVRTWIDDTPTKPIAVAGPLWPEVEA